MKKISFLISLLALAFAELSAQGFEYKVITTVESIVPMGIGRSRMIEEKDHLNREKFTTDRVDGKKSDQGKVKRKELKIDNFAETKMLNFYSAVGLNFQNIASNDAMISEMLSDEDSEGWELFTVVSGVESDAGKDDGNGLFITRFIFRRAISN